MDTIAATVQDHLTALMLDACFDLGRLGLDPDDPRSAVALGRLVAFSSQLGNEVDRAREVSALTARLTVLADALRGLLAAVDTSPGAAATADAVNAARAALGAER